MNIFIDTSAFIALVDKSDRFHKSASDFVKSIKPCFKFHTTNFVLDETITKIRIDVGHKEACRFRDNIFSSEINKIHYITKDIEERAWILFKKYDDKLLSFTDCTSFVLMKKLNIKDAFTFDANFVQVGFRKIP